MVTPSHLSPTTSNPIFRAASGLIAVVSERLCLEAFSDVAAKAVMGRRAYHSRMETESRRRALHAL
jgi:hypothetical protein